MTIDPVAVSFSALIISMTSLLITAHRSGVDRRLQWEQMRGGALRSTFSFRSEGFDLRSPVVG